MLRPRPRCLVLVLALSLAPACGGGSGGGLLDGRPSDDATPPGSCGATGNGAVTGTVGGAAITPVVRASQVRIAGAGVAIVLDEFAGACGQFVATGEHLVLGFCDRPTVRTYNVVGEQQFVCPGSDSFGLVEQGSSDFAESTTGLINITSVTPTCVSGTFNITLRAASSPGSLETLDGSFNAVICP